MRRFKTIVQKTRNGFSEWISPKMRGYLMKCCDCGLVHEIDFRIVRYEGASRMSDFKVVRDRNVQTHLRAKRRKRV